MPDTHPPCFRCRTRDSEAFDSPTSSYCTPCWAWEVDYGRRFNAWAADTINEARGIPRGPFVA